MTDPANDIIAQARQGSVAAVIQVLNDKLADSGVRTRAMFDDGVLQLLCEAPTEDQLEQETLVNRIQQILEAIVPRNIRRVNINSRIVREQQLLWLEEINRDPENQLLWSQEITLKKPNLFKRVAQDWRDRRTEQLTLPKATPARKLREKQQFWRGIVGGASVSLFLLLVGWAVYGWLGNNQTAPSATQAIRLNSPDAAPKSDTSPSATASQAPQASPAASSQVGVPNTPHQTEPAPKPVAAKPADPFVEAVRIAEQASGTGKTAQTPAEWLALAARWQQASDLMASVAANDKRYKTAQDRVELYRRNSESASQEAERRRAEASSSSPTTNQ